MRKNISFVLLIGSVWGIVEATVGHFLHVFSLGIGWLFWFPIAFFFLNSAYQITKKTSCMLYSAMIAAGIKMLDIFYTPRYDYVINPAVSILLEALAVLAVYQYFKSKQLDAKMDIRTIILTGTVWKVFYICYLLFLPESWVSISCLSGMIPFAKFFFLETVMNTLLISLSALALQRVSFKNLMLYDRTERVLHSKSYVVPLFSFFTLILAVIVQIKL